jgi:peptidoglycan/LPS O-acetylase OafA/YrhL
MAALLGILGLVTGLISFVCLIIVLTKLFPAEGVLKGIFGLICGIYALIWGWQNADRYNLKNVMVIWSVAVVIGIIVRVAALNVGKA